jgi:hypothetical protein
MPHCHQQFASDGDNGLLFADAPGQALTLGLPMGMMLHRDPGGFDHHAPQITVLATWDICSEKAIVKEIECIFARCRSM